MSNPRTQKPGKPHLTRDGQQWIYDYIFQQSGLTHHWWSDKVSEFPKSARSHAMISKHLGRQAMATESKANSALDNGNRNEALALFFKSAMEFMRAQHTIFELNAEKTFLYEGLRRLYDNVIELCSYRIERIEVPWDGTIVSGFLHLCPGVERAPLWFHSPGCDVTCEVFPNPVHNEVHEHGMHVFSFDGPGQGQANMRGIRLTPDNYELATSVILDYLVERPEIDATKIIVAGGGAGSFCALRIAAHDHRVAAAVTKNTYTDKYYLMDEEGPRWKRLFGFLTQSSTEEELDRVMEAMTLDGYMERITCPTLMVTGEYDLRDPIDEVFELFDQLKVSAELWLYADMFHLIKVQNGPSLEELMLEWGRDRIDGKAVAHPGEVLYIEPGDPGPNSPDVKLKRHWFEESK